MISGPLLLISSAFLHALWNALAKSSKDKESFLFLTIMLSGLFTLATFIPVPGWHLPQGKALYIAIASGIFEGLYFITLSKALRSGALGTSYAIMRGGAMILVWIISILFLGEVAAGIHYFGAFVILLGLLTSNTLELKKLSGTGLDEGTLWSLVSAAFIAAYHLCYHQALLENAEPRSLFFISMMMSLPFLFWGIRKKPWLRLKLAAAERNGVVVLTSMAAAASFLIFLHGLRISAPGFAISLRNTSIFFAVLFSFLLKENLTRMQIFGAIGIGCGAVLLSF